MTNQKHTAYDLKQMQSLPLDIKIRMTKKRIEQWYEYWNGMVYVSFSGGKDSTVLKHIVNSMYNDIPCVFCNTGLEYPEIRKFALSFDDVIQINPEMMFDEVIRRYGYPVPTKEQSQFIYEYKNTTSDKLRNSRLYGNKNGGFKISNKWKYLIDAPFDVGNQCCNIMKKNPFKKYEKQTDRKPILGTMADESSNRKTSWQLYGCNAFERTRPISQPMAFWTEQDVLRYIKHFNVQYCSVYGDIVPIDEGTLLKTTGCDRTGCIFCMFGCHLEKEPNRFQRLKETHPRQYEYCIGGGEYVDGKWQPSKEGLGLRKVLDYINVKY